VVAAVVDAASFTAGGPISPGSLVTIFGTDLAQGEGVSPEVPWETELAGTLVTLAGRALPLMSANRGQVNAMVPYGVAVNTQHQLIVRKGNTYAVPEGVVVAAAQPSIFTKDGTGKGQGIILNTQGQVAAPGSGTVVGEEIVILCTGLGEVDPPVEAGSSVLEDPLPRVVQPVTLWIGGVEAEVKFAGLVPGQPGVYQVRAVVQEGVQAGDAVEVVLAVQGLSSRPVTMAVR
jgi:uncharacterized protein (TIGR03437 family)